MQNQAPDIILPTFSVVAEIAIVCYLASGTALVIAKERLLAAENLGKLCRDDTIEGLRFYPNLILTQDWTRDTFFKSSE